MRGEVSSSINAHPVSLQLPRPLGIYFLRVFPNCMSLLQLLAVFCCFGIFRANYAMHEIDTFATGGS